MSPRTFARRFKQATGTTPLQWVLHQRVGLAQRLLEMTDLPVELVAERCGFGSGATLRQHFGRIVGTSPARLPPGVQPGELTEHVRRYPHLAPRGRSSDG